jgi:hypothetical protein
VSRWRTLAAALIAATVLVGAWAPAAALAASPDLTLVTDARYDVQPASHRVHVTVDIRAQNHKSDTTTKRYYFDRAYLAVLPGTSGYAMASPSGAKVSVSKRTTDYTLLLVTFGQKVYSGKSLALRLTFNLPDPGGSATRDVRVGQALVTFPVWAYASDSTPGSTVTVVFPKGYSVHFASGTIPGPQTATDGSLVFRTGPIAQPLTFFAYATADRAGAYASKTLDLTVGGVPAPLVLRAWTDDAAWTKRVGGLLTSGLPVLGEEIGLSYPRGDTLEVQESVSRTLGGYAGLFDPTSNRIEVDYAADSFVILHEAAHIWFNGGLLVDRWANEGFASHYAATAAASLKVKVSPEPITAALEAHAIPLNAWGRVGETDQATESYGYAAAHALADAIAARAGESALASVWQDASDRVSAYQPTRAGAPVEHVDGPPDWRGLLDLLESRTGLSFTDLWRTWVVRPDDAVQLDARATARSTYARVVAEAGSWELPSAIRLAMTTWRFSDATGLLAQAGGVLTLRDQVDARATAAGLTPPPTLQQRFEGDAGLRGAGTEARAELATLDAIAAATDQRPATPDLLQQIGLMGASADADLAAARSAFSSGDLGTSVDQAAAARATWARASDVGSRRALSGLGVVLLVLLLLGVAVRWIRGRRRRPRIAQARFVAEPDRPWED